MSESATALVEARATDLGRIKEILESQRARRLDAVVSSTALEAWDGRLRVATGEVMIDAEGVTPIHGTYDVGQVFNAGLGDRLDLPVHKLREWQANRVDIWDAVVNMSLHGGQRHEGTPYPADNRKHLVRLLTGAEGEPGFARAFLSPRYRFIENLDALLAVLQGISEAGIQVVPEVCDLTERRIMVNLVAPEIGGLAPTLLNGYRDHFSGKEAHLRAGGADDAIRWSASRGGWTLPQALKAAEAEGQSLAGQGPEGGGLPVMAAGLRFTNSETGHGKRTLVPYMLAHVCGNRLVLDLEADSKVHLGGSQAEGVVEWSAETIEEELRLIKAQAVDTVKTFLSQEFVDAQIAMVEELAGAPVRKPEVTVKELVNRAGFTKAQADDVFGFFIEGGQPTAGGIANAMTAWAQTLPDAELAANVERKALTVMKAAAAAA
jgi:hypothetical protein